MCKIAYQSSSFTLVEGVFYYLDAKKQYREHAYVPTFKKNCVHGGPFARHFSGPLLVMVCMLTVGIIARVACSAALPVEEGSYPPLLPIPVSRPFQILEIDVMDLPVTQNGNKHVVPSGHGFPPLLTRRQPVL